MRYQSGLTTVADEGSFLVTSPVSPRGPSRKRDASTRVTHTTIWLIFLPVSERGAAAIGPLPGVSVQTYPVLSPPAHQVLDLLVLSLVPHHGQVSVLLPARPLSRKPRHGHWNCDVFVPCTEKVTQEGSETSFN